MAVWSWMAVTVSVSWMSENVVLMIYERLVIFLLVISHTQLLDSKRLVVKPAPLFVWLALTLK